MKETWLILSDFFWYSTIVQLANLVKVNLNIR